MGFKFTYLCNLLSSLEDNRILKATTQARSRNPDVRVVTEWFARHGKRIREPETNQLALLSCMFPEKRTDRVYWLQDTNLARVIGRCLLLGSSRREELEKWRTSGGADLGQCVEDVMRQAENHIRADQEVTVEDIDGALNLIASRCRFSGPKVRIQRSAVDVEETLSPLYRRLSSRDAKWLTRMILKSHFSSIIPERLTLKSFHFLLPHLLLFQNSFKAAIDLLYSQPISHFPHQPEPGLAKDLGKIALYHLSPEIGVKIGRPDYYKARSIRHCCIMVGQRRMSVERKYDGEYCQIHIDLWKYPNSIQIFSKSGKDSTADRAGVHQAVRESLRMGKEGCRFKRRCILEGELLVWSDKHQRIEHFHKLRKFVSRSGAFIGTENDSLPQPYEHLMIVFFDVLLLDDDICLRKPHRERRLLLKDMIKLIPGVADVAEQRIIDFSHSDGQSKLEALFSMGIAERWEGFVLKGCEDPYFPILIDPGDNCDGRWIKLKKDYIPGLGDTLDLALVGAAYNSHDASTLGLGEKVSWTHFFVGCLDNKDSVLQSNAEPRFHVIDVIDHHCMSQLNMQTLNNFSKYSARGVDSDHGFDIEYVRPGMPRIDAMFKTPFVVEMLGSGFEKPSGARYYTLRFPRILKVHSDRSLEDAASFRELQLLAEAAISAPAEDVREQEAEWAKRVKMSTSRPGYLQNRSQSLSTEASPVLSRMVPITAVGSEQVEPICCSNPETLCQESEHGPTKQVSLPNKPFAEAIPVYIDARPASSSSAGPPEPTGSILASNENLSQGNARKRKAASPALRPHTKGICQGSRKDDQSMGDNTSPTLGSMSVSVSMGMAKTGQSSDTDVGTSDNTCQEASKSVRSPLTRIPVFIHSEVVPKEQSTFNTLTNTARTLEEFLLMLKQGDLKSTIQRPTATAASQHSLLGIVFIDCARHPLGETLLQLNKRISQAFAMSASNYYPEGRLFLLNSTFLQLDVNWKSNKFCLPSVWEKISRHYFYACIAWDPETRHEEPIDEISSTPMGDKNSHTHRRSPGTMLRRKGNHLSKFRISFDRRELLDLGEFSSLDPLVRV